MGTVAPGGPSGNSVNNIDAASASGNAIEIPTSVQMPPNFQTGNWTFVQRITGLSNFIYTSTSPIGVFAERKDGQNLQMLDTEFLEPGYFGIQGPNNLSTPYSGATMPTGSNTYYFTDNPALEYLNSPWPLRDVNGNPVSANEYYFTTAYSFETYVLFMPPGAGSQWVPLKVVLWSCSFSAENLAAPGGSNWQFLPTTSAESDISVWNESIEPIWNEVLDTGSNNSVIYQEVP
jgi:hypothetical protein